MRFAALSTEQNFILAALKNENQTKISSGVCLISPTLKTSLFRKEKSKALTHWLNKHSFHIAILCGSQHKDVQFSVEKSVLWQRSLPRTFHCSELPDYQKPQNNLLQALPAPIARQTCGRQPHVKCNEQFLDSLSHVAHGMTKNSQTKLQPLPAP